MSNSGKTPSHSQLLDVLKKLNFRASTGLLCLQETDKSDDIQLKESSTKANGDVVNQNGVNHENTNEVFGSQSANSLQGEESKIDLVGRVKKTVGRNKTIANKCKVFVGNIGYRVRRRELREFFSYFGKVLGLEIIEDRAKHRSRGFGFVTFSNEWEAQKAKTSSDDERMLHNRVMIVSTPTRKRKGGRVPVEEEQSLEDVLEEFKQLSLMQQNNGNVNTEPTESETSVLSISSLNDDIIIYIFTFLGLKDKIRIERVCRRWKNLVLKAWPTVTHLDFQNMFSLYKGGLEDYIILRIFQRGCKNLKSLDLSASPFMLTEFAIHCIAKHCQDLTTIDLSGMQLSTSSLKILAKACSKLEVVVLQRCSKAGEKGLWWLFKECKNLKHINISGNILLTGKCFFMLPPNVESLNLSECTRLTNSGAVFIGNLCRNLQSIDLSGCASLTDAAIIDLLNCSQINKFYFKNCPQTVTGAGLEMMISRLTQLMVLDLSSCSSLNDDLLFHIGRSCTNLICLYIQDCPGDITDAGIQSLVTCDKLEEIDISYNDKVTNTSIGQLALNGSLQKVVARACDGITDEVVTSLVNHCGKLRELDFSGCRYVTDASLEHVVNNYKLSTNGCSLTLIIGGTSISDEATVKARNDCDQIQIVTHDFSSEHLKLRNQRNTMPQFFYDSEDDEEDDDDDDDAFGYGHSEIRLDAFDDFLVADDPSVEEDQEWMFN